MFYGDVDKEVWKNHCCSLTSKDKLVFVGRALTLTAASYFFTVALISEPVSNARLQEMSAQYI
jgi:hypothetical protein